MLHFIPPRTRLGMLLLLAHFTHHMFLEGQTNPVHLQTRHPVVTFQCTPTPSPSIPIYPVLGYPTAFIDCMLRMNLHSRARILAALRSLVFLIALLAALTCSPAPLAGAQRVHLPSSKTGVANLESKTQS